MAAQQSNVPPITQTQAAQTSKLTELIEILRDEEARETFLDGLEKAASGNAEAAVGSSQNTANEHNSLGGRIAEVTRQFAEGAVSSVIVFWAQLRAAPATFANLDVTEAQVLLLTLRNIALVIIVTHGVFSVLRLTTRRIVRSLARRAPTAGFLGKTILIMASAALDIGIIVAAWAAGYVAALTVFGELGRMDIQQTLYLNAFTVVQLAKMAVTSVLSPATVELRLVPLSDKTARQISRVLSWIIGILGYGQLLLQPVLSQAVSTASGQAVSALVFLTALIVAITAILLNKRSVTQWLLEMPVYHSRERQIRFVANWWHWPVLAYLAFLFFAVLIGPTDRLFSVLSASAQAFGAVIVGFALADRLGRVVTRGLTLPRGINHRLPLLEKRVNGLVPRFLAILRFVILALVFGAVLSATGAFDMVALMQSRAGLALSGVAAAVFAILLTAYVLWLALSSWIDYRLNPAFGSIATARETTLLSLLRNAATIAIAIVALMFSLSQMGLDIAPLLASAGVLGLAVGFGAQKLVQDVINGVFIQLENAINVGDVITIGGTTGTVERLTIRSVSLRDVRGAYHIISFSSVEMVTNLMRDFSYHVADIGIAYRENVDDARIALFESFNDVCKEPDMAGVILGDMEWFGVEALADSAVVIRVRIKTRPGKQWSVGRAFNGAVKRIFDARGIEIPFPHQTIYFGVNKGGEAPPAFVSMQDCRTGGGKT